MYRNNLLNTVSDKERWVNGSKDWMEHLQLINYLFNYLIKSHLICIINIISNMIKI